MPADLICALLSDDGGLSCAHCVALHKMLVRSLCDGAVRSDSAALYWHHCLHIQCFLSLGLSALKPMLCVAGYLTSDGVMASKAQTMQSTIEYMNRKYGSAAGYVKVIGITPSEVSAIRLNMLIKAAPRDLLERLSLTGNLRGRGSVSPQSSRDHLSRRTYSSDGSFYPGSPTNDRFDASAGSGKSSGPKNLTRRSKTFSTLSRRSKDAANGVSKQPHDIMINKKISDFD